jgi:glycerate 2-kinase
MLTTAERERERVRGDLVRIYRAAVDAVDPAKLTARALDGGIPDASRVYVLGVGKASAAMASVLAARLGDKLTAATVVILPGANSSLASDPRIAVCESSHPLPSEKSEASAKTALAMLSAARPDDLVIVALSGGASAMFALPPDGVPLADKIALTQSLLHSGASIRELNTVRKHLSAIKGGQLLRSANGARVVSLILSDVPGDDLTTIGSGLTAPDPTTFADAISVLKRRQLWGRAPETIRDHLERGNASQVAETPKSDDPMFARVANRIIGNNQTALDAAEVAARGLGYDVDRSQELRGEANDLGRALATHMTRNTSDRICVIAGGEPVVTVRGSGKGGRAQQAALALGLELSRVADNRRIAALFAGTDGVDGPTDAAGAFAFSDSVARAQAAGLDPETALSRNDAYNLFSGIDDLFVPGSTGTNVADIFVALVNY